MFREWGFLLTEMIGLIILAALLGLFAGWLIWGGRKGMSIEESDELNRALGKCKAANAEKDDKLRELQAKLESCEADLAYAKEAGAPVAVDYDGDGVIEGTDEGVKPEALSGPRGGAADDLKQIKGIGPKLEKLCNSLGFYHFDQIANWTSDEIAWVDANLEGFKGRVSRDNWVAQAKTLAQGGATEFSDRVKKGGVY